MGYRRGGAVRILLLLAVLFMPSLCRAQDSSSEENKGKESGNYNIQQTLEFGYRWTGINGNLDTYDTFINLGSGLRLFDYSLDMRSLNHEGLFFDDLSFSNFGYGGDPNDVSRLRIEKNKWYDFSLVFRRDKNFWDYNLFVNPLNPAAPNPLGSPTTGCIVSGPSTAHPGLPGFCSSPSVPVTNSPHALDLVRRMQDYDLVLFPQSWVRFRLGYSHDSDEGAGFFTTDSGTMPAFPQDYSYTMNAYRAGVDFRVLEHTTVSYDQFLNYFKQDNRVIVTPTATPGQYGYQLADGTPVDLGIVWSTLTPAETLPCASPIAAGTSTTPPTANPNCNGFLSYSQVGRPRNFMPTERFRFQSTDIKNFDMSGELGYSTSNNLIPDFNEILNGYVTRTSARVSTTAGPARATRVSVDGSWSGVYRISDKARIEDTFHYDNWRIPGLWSTFETNLYGAAGSGQIGLALPLSLFTEVSPTAATSFLTLCPAAPYDQAGCPLHTSSSGADVTNELAYSFLGQNLKSNTIQAQYDFSKRWTARIGYLYTNRIISQYDATFDTGETYFPGGATAGAANLYLAARGDCALGAGALPAGCVLNADGSVTEGSQTSPVPEAGNDTARSLLTINANSLLLGFTARPVDQLRIIGDFQFGYNDAVFTRTDPRQVQAYKVHVTYTPKPWATIDGSIDIHENRDDVFTVANLEHDRAYSVTTMLAATERLTVGIGYNYWDVFTQSTICFNYSISYTNPTPPPSTLPVGTSPPGVATTACTIPDASVGAAGLETAGTYASRDHFAHADLMWKPTKRVTAALGYGGSFVRGNTVFLNPLQPSGTLDYNYQMPYGSLTIDLGKGLSYTTAWNYYGFNQTGNTLPFGLAFIPLQDFNGNTASFIFRYSF
jgi:hypothetical protein